MTISLRMEMPFYIFLYDFVIMMVLLLLISLPYPFIEHFHFLGEVTLFSGKIVFVHDRYVRQWPDTTISVDAQLPFTMVVAEDK